jgi:hypothetical protein
MPEKLLTMNTHNSGIIKINEAAGSKRLKTGILG